MFSEEINTSIAIQLCLIRRSIFISFLLLKIWRKRVIKSPQAPKKKKKSQMTRKPFTLWEFTMIFWRDTATARWFRHQRSGGRRRLARRRRSRMHGQGGWARLRDQGRKGVRLVVWSCGRRGGVGCGGGSDALAGRAHGEGGRWEVHGEVVARGLEGPQLRYLLLEAAVLFHQRLAAAVQVLTVHFRLLQLRPVIVDEGMKHGDWNEW